MIILPLFPGQSVVNLDVHFSSRNLFGANTELYVFLAFDLGPSLPLDLRITAYDCAPRYMFFNKFPKVYFGSHHGAQKGPTEQTLALICI
jgi:hypothetical protein